MRKRQGSVLIMPMTFLVPPGCFPASLPCCHPLPTPCSSTSKMPCHNSTWMCFSQLSPAPAGKTKFLKHRKHPAENILIKQTPQILFWKGRKTAPPICQLRVGRFGKRGWEQEPASRGLCGGWLLVAHVDSGPAL